MSDDFKSFDDLELQNLIGEMDEKHAEVFRKALKLFNRLVEEKVEDLSNEISKNSAAVNRDLNEQSAVLLKGIAEMQKETAANIEVKSKELESLVIGKCDSLTDKAFSQAKAYLMKWVTYGGVVASLLGITTLIGGVDWFAGVTADALIDARPKLEATVIEKTTESFETELNKKRQEIEKAYNDAIDEAKANTEKIADDLVTAKLTLAKIVEKHEGAE